LDWYARWQEAPCGIGFDWGGAASFGPLGLPGRIPSMDERSVSIGRLRRVPLREVWPHEALDFTVWLQDNLEVLNEHLETPLANAEREQAAGAFSVDLVAEDDDGRAVVIENQLERSNHDGAVAFSQVEAC
jgi:hypothetical protein